MLILIRDIEVGLGYRRWPYKHCTIYIGIYIVDRFFGLWIETLDWELDDG